MDTNVDGTRPFGWPKNKRRKLEMKVLGGTDICFVGSVQERKRNGVYLQGYCEQNTRGFIQQVV